MRYLGGKFRTWKQITAYLESIREGRDFLEPFVGGAWITQGMSGRRVASDANVALITMYQALLGGWVPPEKVTEEEYQHYKKLQDVSDPMTAFVGFGCSFGGMWFSTYARSNTRNYALNAKNSLMRKVAMLQGVEFVAGDYRTHTHTQGSRLIYCDPPYAGTTQYKAVGAFDSSEFWATMRLLSEHNIVVISEYEAPEDFRCVASFETKTDLHTRSGKQPRIEKLFRWEGSL